MADKKITQLTDLGNALASVDLFHVVDDPSGTPINKKVSASSIFNNIPTFLGLKQASQQITTDGSTVSAADVTSAVTEINATNQAGSVSLANGSDGQIKIFLNTSTSGSFAATITPANLRGHTSIVLSGAGKTAICFFKNGSWNILANTGTTA
tara:strand:+ start:1153 stop:1611 length:459 start_codon:yes stop_codon:yes gene_type:complete